MSADDFQPDDIPPSYEVTCARCGKRLDSDDAVAEEGNEWECMPCNERENARERANAIAECEDILRNMVNFALESGYHEVGFDVVTRLMTLLAPARHGRGE